MDAVKELSEVEPSRIDITQQLARYNEILDIADPRLQQVCKPADPEWLETGEIFALITMMKAHLEETGGVGLAANQVGSDRRVIVIRSAGEMYAMINPVIEHRSKKKIRSQEGCLSVNNGASIYLCERAATIRVRFFFPHQKSSTYCEFNETHVKLEGLESIAVQHEVDHLNGRNITQIGKLIHHREPKNGDD